MQQLDRGSERDELIQVVVAQASGEQHEPGPHPLAPGLQGMVEHALERRQVNVLGRLQEVLNQDHVLGDRTIERLHLHLCHTAPALAGTRTRKRRSAFAVVCLRMYSAGTLAI